MRQSERPSQFEKLDRRLMLSGPEGGPDWSVVAGTLKFNGSADSDILEIDVVGSNFVLTDSGVSETVPTSGISAIEIRAGAGDDEIRVHRNFDLLTTVWGDADNDRIILAHNSHNLDLVNGSVNAIGGSGDDELFADDASNDQPYDYSFDSILLTRPFFGGVLYQSDIERVKLMAGSELNVMNVSSVSPNTEFYFNNAGDIDIVNLGSSVNGLNNFRNNVHIDNDASLSLLNINNGPSSIARSARITHETSGYNRITGFQTAGAIFYDQSEISLASITSGSGADSITIASHKGSLRLNSSGGFDNVRVGDNASGGTGTDAVLGNIDITNTSTSTNVFYDESLNASGSDTIFEINGEYTRVAAVGVSRTVRMRHIELSGLSVVGTAHDDNYRFVDVGLPIRVDTGDGDDFVFVDDMTFSQPITVYTGPQTGDQLRINEDDIGTAEVWVDQSDAVQFISLGVGGSLKLKENANIAYAIGMSDRWDGLIDITDNALLQLDTNSVGGPEYLIGQVVNGYNGGAWNTMSNAIVSSVAANSTVAGDSVGYAMKPQTSLTSLGGFTLTSSSLIIRYTLQGDANLDRTVNFTDLLRVAQNYNDLDRSWAEGNFNYDAQSKVDFNDVLMLAQKYNQSVMQSKNGPASITKNVLGQREDRLWM